MSTASIGTAAPGLVSKLVVNEGERDINGRRNQVTTTKASICGICHWILCRQLEGRTMVMPSTPNSCPSIVIPRRIPNKSEV